MTHTLQTPRLLLRPHRPEDLEPAAALWANPEVTRYIGGRPFTPEEVWARLLRYAGHWSLLGDGYWAITDRQTGTFLGEAGFADHRRALDPPFADQPEIGWALAHAAWGRGLAREAVGAMSVWGDTRFTTPTVCMIQPANTRSSRIAEHFGYRCFAEATYHGTPTRLYRRPPARPEAPA
ncbi:MAG: GNAT family N-acetyltransferase [Alphaproteobacteria bacterium]|nr:GNAT family N-acetyltransferase [Alphaproteobacteria bacterium]